MNPLLFDMPDESPKRIAWLERQLVGHQLGELVAELQAVQEPTDTVAENLDASLGDARQAVLEHGLARLSPDRIQKILATPRQLLELQELVLRDGGAHWRQIPPTSEIKDTVAAVERRLREFVAVATDAEPQRQAEPATVVAVAPRTTRAWYDHPSLSWSIAATLVAVMAVWGYQSTRPHDPVVVAPEPKHAAPESGASWGWGKAGSLNDDLPRDAYFLSLADACEQWFLQRPDQPLALAWRLREFRQGCSALLLAPHSQLGARDRTWLIKWCRGWASDLDEQIAALETGHPAAEVRDAVDVLVRQFSHELRARVPAARRAPNAASVPPAKA